MKDEHMGEAIELYALGALDRDEAREVEDHAAVCADCSRLLAAGLLIAGFGATATREIRSDRATIAADDRAFSAIAVSHFLHTTFTKRVPDAPTAKVLWGKTPQWFYVIVDSASCNCNVVEITPQGERDLGPPAPRGNTATLFVADAPEAKGLELRSGTTVLAAVRRP